MRTRHLASIAALVLVPAVVSPAAPAAEPGAKRAFTIADFYRLRPVLEPAISPDARTVLYSVTTRELEKAKQSVNLWRVDADGKNARALTFGDGKTNQMPSFSPDGQTIAFVSNRSGEPQLWTMSALGGEAEQRTHFPGGIGEFTWSLDGRRLAFSADTYPECGADYDCNKKKDDAREAGKLKAHLADRLLYRHWTGWQEGKRSHVFLLDLAAAPRDSQKEAVRDLTPGDFDVPVFEVGGHGGFALSPDGKELVFSSRHAADPASSTNSDLFVVATDAPDDALLAPKDLTAANEAWDGSPRYSPDGRFIAYRTQKVPRYESDRFRIALYDRQTGQSRVLTEGFDNWITDLAWSRDGRKIYFQADVRGRTPLHELTVATGAIRVLSSVGTLDGWQVSPDGTWAVVSRRRIGEPWELHRLGLVDTKDDSGTRLTFHNADVEKEVDIRPPEEMWVDGADGAKVQVFLVKPHGFDPAKKYPVILNVHGGPQSQWADAFRGDWQVYPGAGYVVAFPNPHGSTGFGQAFTSAISGDWDGKVMEDVSKVADAVAALPYVDADRMGAMGWSWGGYAMMWLEGHATRYKALASMMGVYDLRAMYSATEELWFPAWDLRGAPWEQPDLYRRMSPSEAVKSFKTPCLVITGERDFRVPYTQSLEFFTDLQQMGVPSRLIVYANAGHWPSWHEMALYYAAHLDWFHRYLGGDPSPWDPKDLVARQGFGEKAEEKKGEAKDER